MKTSRFNAAKLSRFKAVAKGSKVVGDAFPELYLSRSMNRFNINGAAAMEMGLKHGDYGIIVSDPNAENVNEKYLFIQTTEEFGNKLAANSGSEADGKPLSFNNSVIWSQMLQLTPDAKPMNEKSLVEVGLMKETTTIKGRDGKECVAVLAASKVVFTPKAIEETIEEIAGVPVIKAWELVDAKRVELKEAAKTEKVIEEDVNATDSELNTAIDIPEEF